MNDPGKSTKIDFMADVLDVEYGKRNWHCDDIAGAKAAPECVLRFLAVERAPAHGMGLEKVPLFATLKGRRVRVVMASRFGDVGITRDLGGGSYCMRVYLPDLTDFRSEN